VKALNGNVCRCGVYERIVTAVEKAAKAMKGGAK
jgi:aerobic-type carbon monoxide dehydrogenase small subunit (CoxS/CutS family)